MANTKSAKKNIRITARRTARNQAVFTRLKTLAKQALAARTSEDPVKAKASAVAYVTAMDRAAKIGIIHRNKASHAKSSVAKILTPAPAKKEAQPAAGEPEKAK
jgi:small subunit ribosomal protein S20